MTKKITSIDEKGELQKVEIEELKVEAPKGRKYLRRDGLKMGRYRGTQTIVQYVEELFIKNELMACIYGKKPLDTDAILRSVKKYFKEKSKGKTSVGLWRSRYNNGTLFSAQEKPMLVSFKYNSLGFIVDKNQGKYYQYWDDCKQFCIDLKIADPRFFTSEELTALRHSAINGDPQFSTWNIPGEDFVKDLTEKIGKDPFNSIKFPKNFARLKPMEQVRTL